MLEYNRGKERRKEEIKKAKNEIWKQRERRDKENKEFEGEEGVRRWEMKDGKGEKGEIRTRGIMSKRVRNGRWKRRERKDR